MKTLTLIFTLVFVHLFSFGQDFEELANHKFKTKKSYAEEEDNVVACADYLLKTPVDKSDINRLVSSQFIIRWMEGTPDYSFVIESNVLELTGKNQELFGLYLAAASKVAIENKGEGLSSQEIYNEAEALLVDYCSNSKNNLKPSKKIKQLIKNK